MDNCIFCKIARGDLATDFIYEDDRVVAFNDTQPQAPTHILIIPRSHHESIKEMDDEKLIGHLFTVGKAVAKKVGAESFRLVINTGKDSGQAVYHVHLHLLAGRKMTWPPG
jgi:histidine triad (HIT) family protein